MGRFFFAGCFEATFFVAVFFAAAVFLVVEAFFLAAFFAVTFFLVAFFLAVFFVGEDFLEVFFVFFAFSAGFEDLLPAVDGNVEEADVRFLFGFFWAVVLVFAFFRADDGLFFRVGFRLDMLVPTPPE